MLRATRYLNRSLVLNAECSSRVFNGKRARCAPVAHADWCGSWEGMRSKALNQPHSKNRCGISVTAIGLCKES